MLVVLGRSAGHPVRCAANKGSRTCVSCSTHFLGLRSCVARSGCLLHRATATRGWRRARAGRARRVSLGSCRGSKKWWTSTVGAGSRPPVRARVSTTAHQHITARESTANRSGDTHHPMILPPSPSAPPPVPFGFSLSEPTHPRTCHPPVVTRTLPHARTCTLCSATSTFSSM